MKQLTEDQEAMELWRLGWELGTEPENLREWGNAFHRSWVKAVEEGRVPNEDVSPGEAFIRLAEIVEEWKSLKGKE